MQALCLANGRVHQRCGRRRRRDCRNSPSSLNGPLQMAQAVPASLGKVVEGLFLAYL